MVLSNNSNDEALPGLSIRKEGERGGEGSYISNGKSYMDKRHIFYFMKRVFRYKVLKR